MILSLIFICQLASSLLSTMTIHAITGSSPLKATGVAAISDTLRWSLIAGVTSQVVGGNLHAIGAAVIGGAIGNYIAMIIKQSN